MEDEMSDKKRICYFCKKEIKKNEERGYFVAIINDKVENFHRDCFIKYKSEGKVNISIKIR